jgi:hypothetical protein
VNSPVDRRKRNGSIHIPHHRKFAPHDSSLESYGSNGDGDLDPYLIGDVAREKTQTQVTATRGRDESQGKRREESMAESANGDEEHILREMMNRDVREEERRRSEALRLSHGGLGGIQVCRSVVQQRE